MAASSSRILDSCCACIVFSRTYQLVWHLTYRMVWCQAALATVLATTLLTLPAPPRKSARHEIIGNPQTKGERHDPPDASTRSTPGPGAGTHRRCEARAGVGRLDPAPTSQALVHPGAVENRGLRNRSASRRHLSHRDAIPRGTEPSQYRLLSRNCRKPAARLDQCARAGVSSAEPGQHHGRRGWAIWFYGRGFDEAACQGYALHPAVPGAGVGRR